VAIIGAGGQAKIIADAYARSEGHEVVGYIDAQRDVGSLWFGHPVLGREEELPDLLIKHRLDGGIVSVGDNFTRGEIVARIEARAPGFTWVNAIHPTAVIAGGCEIGEGVHMMAGAVVNPDCKVGSHSTIDTNASLDHDSVLGRCSSLAPKVATGGGCQIGDFTAISLGTSVIHGRTIGEHAVIGAASLVVRDVPDFVVAYGAPARVIRSRRAGEPYL